MKKNNAHLVELERMRQDVLELELKARYWKAQHDIRHYTLKAEELQAPYNDFMVAEEKKRLDLQEKQKEMIEKIEKAAADGQLAVEEAKNQ